MSEGTFSHASQDELIFRVTDGGHKVYLTLTPDGRLLPGPGLSMDDATQKTAEMLAEKYAAALARVTRQADR